jgi:glycosyltransferase involved in cell wall biosynthesis
MKFSVLLPTRNRLEYLKYAVETVLRQDYSNWEIIVSDNCSEEDILGYVQSLNDSRIVYIRTHSFIPVTDNWNNALKNSTGEYVVMLGDDDGLLPKYFSKIIEAFDSFPNPDFVYVSAYFLAYPGVLPDSPNGFLRRDINKLLAGSAPFILDTSVAVEVAKGYLDFSMPVASNMQFSLISRRKIDELSINGEFFKSPYPDFYATPMLFLRSSNILVYPLPMVIIGITPKSYGFFHFNNRAAEGVEFLKNKLREGCSEKILSIMLPGTSYNDSWLLSNEALCENYSGAFEIYPNYARYRFLQIVHCYKKFHYDKALPLKEMHAIKSLMTIRERLLYGTSMPVLFTFLRIIPINLAHKAISFLRQLIGQHSIKEQLDANIRFENLLEVYGYMNAQLNKGG